MEREELDPRVTSAVANVPIATHLGNEIPILKDHQEFQRACVYLFREELGDPNTQEFGRSGQKQGGIDILGKRNGDPTYYVGIQCRKISEPLKYAKILKDCRDALDLDLGIKEIIFATTAPDDVPRNSGYR